MGMNGSRQWATILPTEAWMASAARQQANSPIDAGDPTRVRVEVVTNSDCPAFIEFRVRLDTVEAWFWERLAAIFDREQMRTWLAEASGWLMDGEVEFAVDPRPSGDRITVALPDVPVWTLSPQELRALRDLL
jgi:hypothetical protein